MLAISGSMPEALPPPQRILANVMINSAHAFSFECISIRKPSEAYCEYFAQDADAHLRFRRCSCSCRFGSNRLRWHLLHDRRTHANPDPESTTEQQLPGGYTR
jgi:hypothetical protein